MSKVRIVLSVGLCILAIWSWVSYGSKVSGREEKYSQHIQTAEEYVQKKLFQKAVKEYESAFAIKEDEESREAWLKAIRNGVDDHVLEEVEYETALYDFCMKYPERTDRWEELIKSQIDIEDFDDARMYYRRTVKLEVTSEKIEEYKELIYYSYREWGEQATEITESTSGKVRIYSEKGYGIQGSDGEMITLDRYPYIGPLGKEPYYLISSDEKEARVLDDAQEVQSVFEAFYEDTKAIGDFLIPCLENGKWYYFDYQEKKKVLGPYDDVSTFCDGTAAVKKGEKWVIINTNGEEVGAGSFSDVVLLGNGEYAGRGYMIASNGKAYGIYDPKGNAKCDFTAQKMDFCMGDWVAYQDNSGKWGFVSLEGEVMIKPEYEEALSFSNDLAAVKKDGAWGFINHSNAMVIENKYVCAGHFADDGTVEVGLGEHPLQWHVLALRFQYGK
jgi:tetratricopeptide (TPR) repeat protein